MSAAASSSRAQKQSPATPYSSAARISDSQCYPEYTASLKCLEEFSADKSKCQEHFDVYKECKKKEREARLELIESISLLLKIFIRIISSPSCESFWKLKYNYQGCMSLF